MILILEENVKKFFYKNSAARRSCFLSMAAVGALLIAALLLLRYDERILYAFIAAAVFYAFYIALCAKRFFTKVSFNERGIELIFFGKTYAQFEWHEIKEVKRGVECRRACFALCDGEGKTLLLLERRKEIADIIAEYVKKDA